MWANHSRQSSGSCCAEEELAGLIGSETIDLIANVFDGRVHRGRIAEGGGLSREGREGEIFGLGGDEGVEGEFGGAEEAEGDGHGAEAGIDVEVEVANAVVAEDVFVTEVGGFDGAEKGGADLAAVGVAGELDGGEVLGGEAVGGVGFVEEEDVGFGGVPVAEGGFGIGVAGPGGIEAGDPEGAAGGLEADGFVDEGADAELLEVGGDAAGAVPDVVIAEAGEDAEGGF